MAVTNPLDVVKIRLQLDNELRGDSSRYYRGLVRGAVRIVQDEGIKGLYKGCVAVTVGRQGFC